ncbi:MAG: polysaccharide pyruvyl transferase family protein [Alteromonadaceae bacterium]|nr:polysaccharide pyruvyl transferase family protein [Alteromonadaceae bacterium]
MSALLIKIKQKLINSLISEIKLIKLRNQKTINVKYFTEVLNWGDMINIDILEHISDSKVVDCPLGYRVHLLGIGSVLVTANKNSIVWGSGFISENQKVKSKPLKVCAVRGPKSRAMLLEQDIECPEVFGDPALLLPEIYSPPQLKEKPYKLGIVPHYDHKNHPWIKKMAKLHDVKIIDIQQQGIHGFIDDILECQHIASSSLHGIIAADAYKIPNCRILLADMNHFKFDDYHLGIGVEKYNTLNIKTGNLPTKEDVINNCQAKDIQFDAAGLKLAFPYEAISH